MVDKLYRLIIMIVMLSYITLTLEQTLLDNIKILEIFVYNIHILL